LFIDSIYRRKKRNSQFRSLNFLSDSYKREEKKFKGISVEVFRDLFVSEKKIMYELLIHYELI